jgi:hypothetical protein
MDQYRAHFSELIRFAYQNRPLKLIPVPKGGTGRFQPLDRTVFGGLKARAKKRWAKLFLNKDKKITKQEAVELLLDCWKCIGDKEIIEAWNIPQTLED